MRQVVFAGGPLHGQRRLHGSLDFVIAKPVRLSYAGVMTGDPVSPLAPDVVTGSYVAAGCWSDEPNVVVMRWRGWSDGSEDMDYVPPGEIHMGAVRLRVEGTSRPVTVLLDNGRPPPAEWWPDAMRFDPTVGDDEIEAWQEILHAKRR